MNAANPASELAPNDAVRRVAAERWLCSDDVVLRGGEVISWANPAHPGYAYQEAAGLWLAHFCLASPASASDAPIERVASRLASDVLSDGGAGRGGTLYLFDSAVALRGLVAHAALTGKGHDEAMDRLVTFIAARLNEGVPIAATKGPSPGGRWSTDFAPHLLKAVVGLSDYASQSGDERANTCVDRLAHAFSPSAVASLISRSDPDIGAYTHAVLYALEGLVFLAHRRLTSDAAQAAAETLLEQLAMAQRADGSMPAWISPHGAVGCARTDVTAQALRLWTAVDRGRFASSIASAASWIYARQAACGALPYEPGSADMNTWATIFSLQAVEWAERGAIIDELL